MKKLLLILIFTCVASLGAWAQTSSVSATITDSTSQAYANGTYDILFRPAPGVPGTPTRSGSTFTQHFSGVLDSSGAFAVTLTRNDFIQPGGSQWTFTICPLAASACFTSNQTIAAASVNLTAPLHTVTPVVSVFSLGNIPAAYSSSEIVVTPNPGSFFWNLTTGTFNFWNGASWTAMIVPTSNITFSGNNIFTGSNAFQTITAQIDGPFRIIDVNTPGADWCAKLGNQDVSLGATHGYLIVRSNAIINACASVPPITSGHTIWLSEGGVYALSNTLTISGNGTRLIGVGGGIGEFGALVNSGVTLQAIAGTFPTTGVPVVKFFDITHGVLDAVNVDCNGVTNCIEFHYDSDNNPPSSHNLIQNFTFKGGHQAIVAGLSSNVATSAALCVATPAQPGCYQMDALTIRQFQIYGTCSDLTGEGIHVNSANALQNSPIEEGNIQCVNKPFHLIATNGVFPIRSVNDGSLVGTSPSYEVVEATVSKTPNIYEGESESPTGAIVDHANPPLGTPSNPVWIGNAWNNTVSCDGALEQIIDIGSSGSGSTFTASGGCKVTAIGTAKWATTPGSVFTWNVGVLSTLQGIFSSNVTLTKSDGTLPNSISNDNAGGFNFSTNAGNTWELFNTGRLVSPPGLPLQLIEGTPTLITGATIDSCAGSSTTHTPVCNFNNGNNPHPLRTVEVGTCTMASGTCTVTWSNPYNVAPIVSGTWNGTGTFTTGASLKCTATVNNSVCTSSTGTDTAVIMVSGIGNPN